MMKKKLFIACISSLIYFQSTAQVPMPSGVSGNFQLDLQTYKVDSAIGAYKVPEKMLNNSFLNVLFTKGHFTAGLRYEAYLNVIQGYDTKYNGTGIMYRYAEYNTENLTITAGSFYDQFGSGLIFRSYVEPGLGFDNCMDGIRAKFNLHGVYLKGFIARQRAYFTYGQNPIRGIDGEINLNEFFDKFKDSKTSIIVGGSFVSRFQKDADPRYVLPENVGAWATRLNIHSGGFSLYGEYAYKINDPSAVNGYIYKPGEALYLNLGYTKKGLGIQLAAKRIDNFDFRSDRTSTGITNTLNYLPAINKEYTYRLPTLYPYATQPNGEMGANGEVYYTFKPGSKLGGKYGTTIAFNGSLINSIEKSTATLDSTNYEYGYTSDFFKLGDEVYYQDFGFDFTKKISKSFKFNLDYYYIVYNQKVIEGHPDSGIVYSNTIIGEMTYKFNSKNSLRAEVQWLTANRDRGDWAFLLLEYSVSPHWSFSAFDEYNYGNANPDTRFHYPNVLLTYIKGANRFAIGYARQRSGLLCVGGVCRYVPAANGLTFSITSSF